MEPQLIIALDTDIESAKSLVLSALDVGWFKVGYNLFLPDGKAIISFLQERGRRVFLDLKFHDIPFTMANAARQACSLGVDMFNVHIAAGNNALRQVSEVVRAARDEGQDVLCIGVTRLTSQPAGVDEVVDMACVARECGLDGVVCSVYEVQDIKSACGGDFICVCPGIRLARDVMDDQQRVATPADAAEAGADFIVMGRSIMRMREEALRSLPHSLFRG